MRTPILLLSTAAMVAACVTLSPAQITLANTATGGPPSATTTGNLHSIDKVAFRIGTQSCLRTSVAASSYLPTSAALDPTSTGMGGPNADPGFTIQWWCKVTNATHFGYMWGDSGWTSFRCFQNGVAGVGNIIIRGPLTDLATTGAPLQNSTDPNGWVHFACVVNSKTNTTTWYVNGKLNNSGTAAITGKGTNLKCFGYDGSTSGVPGNTDDLRIYNWARTAADVNADYNAPAGGFGPSGSPNVPDLGYYQCEPPTQIVASGSPRPGGLIDLDLLAIGSANLPYQVGSSFGIGPIPMSGRKLGLSLDDVLIVSVQGLLPGIFKRYAGFLDAQGKARAQIKLPNDQGLVGVRLHSAFVTIAASAPQGIKEVSNTASFSISR